MFEQHLKSADFYFKDNTCYDVISGARGHHENFLPTLIPRYSLDKHNKYRHIVHCTKLIPSYIIPLELRCNLI